MIYFYFIRHAFSYGNAISHLGGLFSPLHKLYWDPPLTIYGKQCCQQDNTHHGSINDHLPHIDLVLTSALIRSVQTGVHLFPNHVIYPFPYLAEQSFGLDNSVTDQRRHQTILGDSDYNRVCYKYILNSNNISSSNFIKESNQSDIQEFFKSFINLIFRQHQPSKDLHVAVVTHCYFMRNYFQLNQYPKNLCTVKITLSESDAKDESLSKTEITPVLQSSTLLSLPPSSTSISSHPSCDYCNVENNYFISKPELLNEGVKNPNLIEFNHLESLQSTQSSSLFWKFLFKQSIY